MAKSTRSATMGHLHAAARLARTALAARLLTHGFYAGQDQIMLALDQQDGQTPGQLAMRIGVRPPTITKTINRLQTQGFLEKRASETDARQAHIFLTEGARRDTRHRKIPCARPRKRRSRGIDKKDQKTLIKLLSRVEVNLSDVPAAATEDDDDSVEVS